MSDDPFAALPPEARYEFVCGFAGCENGFSSSMPAGWLRLLAFEGPILETEYAAGDGYLCPAHRKLVFVTTGRG